jgi:hypothetical protein
MGAFRLLSLYLGVKILYLEAYVKPDAYQHKRSEMIRVVKYLLSAPSFRNGNARI